MEVFLTEAISGLKRMSPPAGSYLLMETISINNATISINNAGSLDQQTSPKVTKCPRAHQDAHCTFRTSKMRLFFPQHMLKQQSPLLQGAVEAKGWQKFKKGLTFMGENNPSRTLRWKDTISGLENPWDAKCWRLKAHTGEVQHQYALFSVFFKAFGTGLSTFRDGTIPPLTEVWDPCMAFLGKQGASKGREKRRENKWSLGDFFLGDKEIKNEEIGKSNRASAAPKVCKDGLVPSPKTCKALLAGTWHWG